MLEKLPDSVGHALVNQRAGMDNVVYNQLHRQRQTARLELRSRAFVFNGQLPVRFTADGAGVSPPLDWDQVPQGTSAIVMIVEDADSPTPHPLVHAIVTGLGNTAGALEEGGLASPSHEGSGLATGQNSYLQHAWLPPDPPRGHGLHRYVFQVFALGAGAPVDQAPGRRGFIDLVLGRAIGVGCLIGTYERSDRVRLDDGVASVADGSAGLDRGAMLA